MDFPSLDQDFCPYEAVESLVSSIDSRLKTADLLFLGRDDAYKRSVISDLLDKDETPYSRASVIGGIKFNLSDFGELQTARRLWGDYSARRGAVVYVVNLETILTNRFEAREDLDYLLYDENFEMVPFLILCKTADPYASEEGFRTFWEGQLCADLGLTNTRTGRGRVDLAGRNPPS